MIKKTLFIASHMTLATALLVSACGPSGGSGQGAESQGNRVTSDGSNSANQGGGSPSAAPKVALRVLSYNTFFLPADRAAIATTEQRLKILPDALVKTSADIIILQEVWTPTVQSDLTKAMLARGYNSFQLEKRSKLPPFFLGNGLLVFARSHIRPAGNLEFLPWSKTAGFDKYAEKGALRVPLLVDGVGRVDVYNAHTSFLPWDGEHGDYDYSERDTLLAQISQLTDWVKKSDADVKILGADLNTSAFIWDRSKRGFDGSKLNAFYTKLREEFHDPFAIIRPECRFTCDTWDNNNNNLLANGLFGSERPLQGLYDQEPNAKLDYVLYSGDGIEAVRAGTAMEAEFPLVMNLKTFNGPLSDHFGIFTDLKLAVRR